MRALIALLPLAAGTSVTVTDTTCSNTHARTSFTGITGRFLNQEGAALSETNAIGDRASSEVERHDFSHTGIANAGDGPGCFNIRTTNSDGWKLCGVEISSDAGGTHGTGGTWTWSGHQWVDNPCTGCSGNGGYCNNFQKPGSHNYDSNCADPTASSCCTNSFTICDWTHVANRPRTEVTVRDTTCGTGHSQTTHRYITGQFVTRGGAAQSNPLHLGNRIQNQVESHTFMHTGGLDNGPGCFRIATTNSDGWHICEVQISAATAGTHGLGGTWTWSGQQWVDNPCTGGYTCTPTFTICDWTHTATTAAPTTAAPVSTCTAVVHQHGSYGGTRQTYVGPMTGEFRAGTGHTHGQASSMRITGTPGCMVKIYCHAGPASYGSGCWYHSNSPCNRANTAPCHDGSGNWEETYTVPSSGSLNIGFLQHNDPRNAMINIVPTGAVGVSGDPFVTYKGKQTQVWLPLEKEIPLMQCDAWELRGIAFGTGVDGDSKQWFRSLTLLANGAEQIRVEAKDTHQLAVTGSQGFFNYTVAKDVDEETVTVTAPGTGLELTSATAKGLAEARVHVDLKITQLNEAGCRGVLPEVWGVQPMSENTAAMLLPH